MFWVSNKYAVLGYALHSFHTLQINIIHFKPQATPPMVKIPYRMMLDVLLESLGLPLAEYRTKACEGDLKL